MTSKAKGDPLDLAPHSQESEECVLGSLLMNPEMLNSVMTFLRDTDFFFVKHGWIYAAIQRCYQRDGTVDTRTLAEQLRTEGHLEDLGGEAYLNYLPTTMPTSLHAEVYAHLVERAAIRRRLLGSAGEIARLAHDETQDIQAVVGKAQQAVFEITNGAMEHGITWFSQEASTLFDALESWRTNAEPQEMDTPLPDLNKVLLGIDRGEVVVIAGGPKMGKTSLMLQWALHGARKGYKGLIFSMEMSERALLQRIVAQETGISTVDQRKMTDAQWKAFVDWFDVKENTHRALAFDKKRSHTAVEIAARCRQFASQYGLDFIVIDYLQLMSTDKSGQNRNNEVGESLRRIKELTMSMDIRTIVGSQFSRDFIRANRAPTLSDLRDSGEIEQHIDKAVFIHSPGGYDTDALKGNSMRELIVAAHRNGPTGTVPTTWLSERVKFESYSRQKEMAWIVRDTSLTAANTAG